MLTELTKIHRRQQLLREAMKALATATQASIDALDILAGDPDIEDSTDLEDEGMQPHLLTDCGPGCDVADPDGPSSPEWTSLGRLKGLTPTQSLPHEDAEQDDEPEDDNSDSCSANEDRGSAYSNDDGLPGDADDAEQEHDDEVETWAHWMDHPAELHIGQRPGHTTDQDVR